jgi:hypothetical protein
VLCTVTLNEGDQDYGHPITTLLGNFFNSMNEDDFNFEEALGSTEVCVALVEGTEDEYELFTPEEGEECPLLATVTGENEENIFQIVLTPETEGTLEAEGVAVDDEVCVEYDEVTETYMLLPLVDEECEGQWATVTGDNGNGTFEILIEEVGGTLGVDEETANGLSEALGSLMVDWGLNEDGSLEDAGDKIGELHDSGVGFGVIVKLYAIAQASDEVDLDDLIAEYLGGASVGELFKKYGKPALVGVGHVRKEAANDSTMSDGAVEEGAVEGSFDEGPAKKDKGSKGICNAKDKGGKAEAKGHGDVDCGDGE